MGKSIYGQEKKKYYGHGYYAYDHRHRDLHFCRYQSGFVMTQLPVKKNRSLVIKLVAIAVGMFGFGCALVPLYNVFCQVTGINGKTNTVAATNLNYEVSKDREVTVEFVTSLNKTTPMEFSAKIKKLRVHPGEFYTVNFFARNKTDKMLVAQAIPSITPGPAAEYFKKTECFCFSQQTFKPGESKTMPVRFVVNPELPERYNTITLSYTFFDITDKSKT